MRNPRRNVGASVRARLLNLAKERNQPFDLLLTRYVLERLLYRLSQSKHCDRFVLKGAILMTTWLGDPHRPTRDLDLLGLGDPDPEAMIAVFREVCALEADDAVLFDTYGLTVDRIRDEQEYGGLRLKTIATVDGARVRVVVDIGFGDAVVPGVEEMELPVLLDLPAPHLRAYPRETVIAEKFQAMVMLGRANSRMKDFHDIWVLKRSFAFKGAVLARAIAATFARRKTEIPAGRPDALSRAFAEDPVKQQQWEAFLQDVAVKPPGSLADVLDELADFLMPATIQARALPRRTRGANGAL
jgi:predicted nucleotidyltransferase component of viral defense system